MFIRSPSWGSEASQPQLPRKGPDGQPNESSQLERLAGKDRFGFLADHAEIQAALARAGAGLAILPDFMIGDDEALVPARPDDRPSLREVWLVFHADMKAAVPVRAVIGCLRSE